MALHFYVKCDHAMCKEEYDVHFASLEETYNDVLVAIREKLGWTVEMSGLNVTRAYCKEHSK